MVFLKIVPSLDTKINYFSKHIYFSWLKISNFSIFSFCKTVLLGVFFVSLMFLEKYLIKDLCIFKRENVKYVMFIMIYLFLLNIFFVSFPFKVISLERYLLPVRDHSFSIEAKFSKKIFLTPLIRGHIRSVRNVIFLENFADVINGYY